LRHFVTVIAAASMCVLAAVTAGCSRSSLHTTTTAERFVGSAPNGPRYYLSLGDSLAQGIQPNSRGTSLPTTGGYADRLYALLRREDPMLRLVKLGCSGETSFTMIKGGICHYPLHSQLAEAEHFLREHRGRVSLVTIDIGANDPNSCFIGAPLGQVATCMNSRVRLTVGDLNTILSGLRKAGGAKLPIIGMDYYVPELAGWLRNMSGKEIAVLSERLVDGYNDLLISAYRRYDARVANVFDAFHSSDFTDKVHLPGIGTVPRNVATICELTWACAKEPRGPNEHANDTGYAIIALAFLIASQS